MQTCTQAQISQEAKEILPKLITFEGFGLFAQNTVFCVGIIQMFLLSYMATG